MKKFLFAGLVCLISCFCTGCVNFDYKIEINDKEAVSLSETRTAQLLPLKYDGFRKSIMEEAQILVSKYEVLGWGAKQSCIGDTYKFYLNKNVKTLGEASISLPKGFVADEKSFTSSSGSLNKHYKIHLVYDINKAFEDAKYEYKSFYLKSNTFKRFKDSLDKLVVFVTQKQDAETGDFYIEKHYASGNVAFNQYNANQKTDEIPAPQATLTIKIPYKATSHNATKVISDTEYQWDLSNSEQPIDIVIEYDKNDFSNIAVIFSLILLVGGVMALSKKLNGDGPVQGL